MPVYITIIVITSAILIICILLYNRLVRLRQNVREGWSAIETELRRRYELVPNLVAVVKGYAAHERDTLENVVRARNAAQANPAAPAQQAARERDLTTALRGLLAVSEAYPDLKASDHFLDLHRQLVETEDRISKARRYYNATVREMNTAVETFPALLLAGPFGFHTEDYFETGDPAAADPVGVDL